MELIYHRGATADVRRAIDYLERERPGLGQEFREELRRVESRILAMPLTYPLVEADVRRILLNRFQFSVFYDIRGDVVRILAVAHHKRRPDYWHGRMK